MEFKHNESNLKDALNISQKDISDCTKKIADILKDAVLDKDFKYSHVVEKILLTFSYNELVLISSVYVLDKIKDSNSVISAVLNTFNRTDDEKNN